MVMASKLRMTSTEDIELRAVVKFCVGLKLSTVDTLKQLKTRTHYKPVENICLQTARAVQGR